MAAAHVFRRSHCHGFVTAGGLSQPCFMCPLLLAYLSQIVTSLACVQREVVAVRLSPLCHIGAFSGGDRTIIINARRLSY